jgi:hypothetical protein
VRPRYRNPVAFRHHVAVWSESLLPATALASIIAGDSLHRVRSSAFSAPRPVLKGAVTPAHFHAVAAPPRQDDSSMGSSSR